jgi:methylenetetrahydrofolate reductase (NADPH)
MRAAELYNKKRPVISMEFFPFRDDKTAENFNKTIDALAPLNPDYLSVTFGAGGSTREGSAQTINTIIKEKELPCVAYIAGYGLSPDHICRVLDHYQAQGIKTIFILRGDQPRETDFVPHPKSFAHASDLISFIGGRYDFDLGCAGYPEGHVEALSLEKDIEYLKLKVDAGAQYVVVQYFYDNAYFFDYEKKCRQAGIDVPIIPGIMPVYTLKMTRALSKICGTKIPGKLAQKMDTIDGEDKAAVLDLGINFALDQCRELLEKGVSGLHFYTMNRSHSTREIIRRLKLERLL